MRANLSRLLREARQGGSILITSRNVIVAEIGLRPRILPSRRVAGLLKGRIRVGSDFNDLLSDLIDAMESEQA